MGWGWGRAAWLNRFVCVCGKIEHDRYEATVAPQLSYDKRKNKVRVCVAGLPTDSFARHDGRIYYNN